MRVGQSVFRVSISLKTKDFDLLTCLARESLFFRTTSLAARYVIERVYKEAQVSKACQDYQRGGKQVDLFKSENDGHADSKTAVQTIRKTGGRKIKKDAGKHKN